jgi:excisionase family DNA binding protein
MDTSDDSIPEHVARLLLTPSEAAHALGVSRSLLYSLIMSQQLFSVKVGKARRIPVQSLHEYVGSLIDMQKAG